jgi:hypothetical protein
VNEAQKVVKEDIVNVIKLGIDAAGYVTLTDYEVEQVLKNIYPRTATNQFGQPIGDYPDKIPTQEEFDKYHETPQDYGDEADWVLVSKKFTQEQALALIQGRLKDEWGLDESEPVYPKSVDDLQSFDIGWGYDHDSYHYEDGGYWICSESNNVTKRWEAWGIATQ